MSAALEETSVSYEELADIELDFEDVETEIIRIQNKLSKAVFDKRQATVSKIPNFWPLVIEQAPPDIDQYIQPSDSALLLSSLTSLSVSHFEIGEGGDGDPRSISFRWEFSENEYFEDSLIEKKFWHRHARDGWSGLVSEPVDIKWKKGKDLTGGMLSLVRKVWEDEQAFKKSNGSDARRKSLTPDQKSLKKRIENTGMGGMSFFGWFGFIGRDVSAQESQEAVAHEKKKRQLRRDGEETELEALLAKEAEWEKEEEGRRAEADDELKELDEDALEIFPDGDDLAVTIDEDLWPGAIKYFTQAQEQDALSDVYFESDEDDGQGDEMEDGHDGQAPPAKKRKA